ncbi:MAG: EscU/YscU/HrcU family type III secretion system export apparatus switch protein [Candidatus Hydrogenedentes bacterium]|nr:EscU/YscU/HrcU family type III secretion system export apparatus switch protein [Candidatus Hydrogenedentota bacterium]
MSESKPPRKQAVAIRYQVESDAAPKVVATGKGHLADRILAIAKAEGIHVQEDPDLLALLAKLDVNDTIPEDLYRAVAEVLAFVYRLNREHG